MNILVTGVNGFVGKHLARELNQRGIILAGLGRESSAHKEIAHLLDNYYSCDLMDKTAIHALPLNNHDVIINLAGIAVVRDSFTNPEKYKSINVNVLGNLCNVLTDLKLNPRLLAISTGAVYDPSQPLPLAESSQLIKDGSPYAISKLLMEQEAQKYQAKGLNCIIVRPFNHIGPGQESGLMVPDFYDRIIEAKSSDKTIKVGNLGTKRDYTDVRDVVKAYAELAEADSLEYDLYNICTGRSVSGQVILDLLLEKTGLSGSIKTVVDKSLLRPNDAMDIYGSYERLHNEVGWQPFITLEKTIEDFVNSREN